MGFLETRYSSKDNMSDYDYHMTIKNVSPIIHSRHYKNWRNSGVAFDSRFNSYICPNRTMSSYLPGKRKRTIDKVEIRGYFGDITNSPYGCFGIKTDQKPEKDYFYHVRNTTYVYTAM